MNFNWELSDFCVTSRNKYHVSSGDYLFQVFTSKPRVVKVAARTEVLARIELLSRTAKMIGSHWHEIE